jgi:alpha-galactosidase
MVNSPVLRGGTLALVDTDRNVLDTMMKIARRAVEASGAPTRIEGATDRTEVLRDADFVVFTFSKRNTHYRGLDCELSRKHGIRMCSGDTIGPGGVFRALREIPVALEIAKDVERMAPDAWVVNFVNPATVLGIALDRYAPNVRSFAICDGPHEPWNRLRLLKRLEIVPENASSMPPEVEQRLDMEIVGVNHFTWVTHLRYDGRDYLPRFRELLAESAREERAATDSVEGGTDNNAAAKRRFNATYALELMDIFGAYPDRIGHTKEYVPFFQGYGVSPVDPEPITIFDSDDRQRTMDAFREENERYAAGEKPIEEFLKTGKPDHATDIIESMWGDLGKRFFLNTRNRGAVPNMADDAILELRCDVDMGGVSPRPSVEIPAGILGMTRLVLDTHELTARAAVTYDRDVLLRALCTDPIINNIADAKAVMDDLLEAERDILPARWYE